MENTHQHRHEDRVVSKSKFVLIGFLGIIAYFLVTEHRAHVIAFLPYLLLLACPLMHIFMHGGHGRHHHRSGYQSDQAANREKDHA